MMGDVAGIFWSLCDREHDLSVVRVGANDGITGDPFWPVISRHPHWRVLYIEPHPVAFQRLKANFPDGHLANMAVSTRRETRTMYEVRLPSDNPDFHHDMLSSFDAKTVLKAGQGLTLEEFKADCMPLRDLLDEFSFPDPDVYLIDCEGYDLEVLRQITNRPLLIIFEHRHLSDPMFNEAVRWGREHGYTFHMFKHDVALIRND